ncbi:hypothetical protein [Hyphomonas sp.]|uniref:hypothetical protein n=1 Tax=Hyphomonas sp. TaxID=87 RepID=UPI003918D756
MNFSRRTMLTCAASVPLAPLVAEAAQAARRPLFVFDEVDPVREIVANYCRRDFGVEVLGEALTPGQARALIHRDPSRFSAIYWRGGEETVDGTRAVIWSDSSQVVIDCPFTVRQMLKAVSAVTGWECARLRP